MSGQGENRISIEAGGPADQFMKHLPPTERDALRMVMEQSENDLKSAHAEICKLQNLDPEKHTWPAWTPQANSLRWFAEIRAHFKL